MFQRFRLTAKILVSIVAIVAVAILVSLRDSDQPIDNDNMHDVVDAPIRVHCKLSERQQLVRVGNVVTAGQLRETGMTFHVTFHNDTKHDCSIRLAKKSCSCIVDTFKPRILHAGENCDFELRFNVFPHPADITNNVQYNVRSKDGTQAKYVLAFTGKTFPRLWKERSFERELHTTDHTEMVELGTIFIAGPQTTRAPQLTCDNHLFTTTLSQPTKIRFRQTEIEGLKYTINLHPQSEQTYTNIRAGRYERGNISLRLDESRPFVIPFVLSKRPLLVPSPKHILFCNQQRQFTIQLRGLSTFDLVSAVADTDQLHVDVQLNRADESLIVSLQIADEALRNLVTPSGYFRTTIVLKLKNETMVETVSIPVIHWPNPEE